MTDNSLGPGLWFVCCSHVYREKMGNTFFGKDVLQPRRNPSSRGSRAAEQEQVSCLGELLPTQPAGCWVPVPPAQSSSVSVAIASWSVTSSELRLEKTSQVGCSWDSAKQM